MPVDSRGVDAPAGPPRTAAEPTDGVGRTRPAGPPTGPIPVMVAHGSRLIRQAFVALLQQHPELRVVSELGAAQGLIAAARRSRPRVLLLDPAITPAGDLPGLCQRLHTLSCRVLIVADAPDRTRLLPVLARILPYAGIVHTDDCGTGLLAGLRRLADGEAVIDPDLAVAVLTAAAGSPLTGRERDVLRLAARGAPAGEIAAQLFLSTGTVRNYLSKAVGKLGARSRIEAVLRARDAGWI